MRNYPQLNLVLTSLTDKTKILRVKAFVDTGFNGTLCVSEKVRKKLGLKLIGKAKTVNADDKQVGNQVAGLAAAFLSLEAESSEYKVPVIIKDISLDCVIGMQLLQLFAKDNQAHLIFNFLQDKIQFVES